MLPTMLSVLDSAQRPMQFQEIHSAVEAALGQSVPRASLKSCLSFQSSDKEPSVPPLAQGLSEHAVNEGGSRLRRIRRGWYGLR